MTLRLLLSHADEGLPVVESPIPLESVLTEPLPAPRPRPKHLHNMAGAPDSLAEQRWALVVPKGKAGNRLASLLKPLVELRSKDQGTAVEVFRASAGMDTAQACAFRDEIIHNPSRPFQHHARYVLLAGSPCLLSTELQEVLAGDSACFVGRLAFEREEDYEAYVTKLVACEQGAARPDMARALFLSVDDGTPAVEAGQEFIVAPAVKGCRAARRRGRFPASEIIERRLPVGGVEPFLELASVPTPSLLFSLSHGVGAPKKGWSTAAEQRGRQGNLALGGGIELAPEDIRHRPFLPGGIWFYFACFGAGTPMGSVYAPWMERLVRDGALQKRELEQVWNSRPLDARPFSAALPQAALANPRGPLAVIGHMDLAWLSGFHNLVTGQTHVHRLEEVLTRLVEGCRAGVALQMLSRFAAHADGVLRRHSQAVAEGPKSHGRARMTPGALALLWMERHDVANYVLLGDPAVRLIGRATR
jgi:hypothetical protein